MEELEEIRAYDAVKAHPSDSILFDEAIKEIEREE